MPSPRTATGTVAPVTCWRIGFTRPRLSSQLREGSDRLPVLLYSLDRHVQPVHLRGVAQRVEEVLQALKVVVQAEATHMDHRDLVVCDRYVASNLAHQGSQLEGAEREGLGFSVDGALQKRAQRVRVAAGGPFELGLGTPRVALRSIADLLERAGGRDASE